MHKQYRYDRMNPRSRQVENDIEHAKYIPQAIDELARKKNYSLLKALGVPDVSSDIVKVIQPLISQVMMMNQCYSKTIITCTMHRNYLNCTKKSFLNC